MKKPRSFQIQTGTFEVNQPDGGGEKTEKGSGDR